MISRRAFLIASAIPVLHGQNQKQKMFSNAEAYNRFMGRWSSLMAAPLLDFAAIPSTGRILDVGTGTGALAIEIVKRKPAVHVTGIDPSEEFFAYARTRSPFPDRTTFQPGDAQDLKFPGATFSASLSLLVFNFIPDPAKALRELRRVTRSGAGITAAVWDYGDRMRMLRAFWDAAVSVDPAAEKQDEKHMPLCRAGQLSQLWKQGGLKNIQEKPLEIAARFSTFADYWDPFLLGQGPAGAYVRNLLADKLPALRNAVKRQLSLSSESQPFTLPARVWAVRGTVPAK